MVCVPHGERGHGFFQCGEPERGFSRHGEQGRVPEPRPFRRGERGLVQERGPSLRGGPGRRFFLRDGDERRERGTERELHGAR